MSSDWPLVPVGEVAQLFDGPHATPKKTENGPVFLGISSLKRGLLDLSSTEHLSEEDFSKWTRRVTPQVGDVVFSYETRIGEVAIIPEGLRCCLGRRMALLRPDQRRLLPKYLLYYFLSDEFQGLLRTRTIHGSTVDRLPLKDFPSYPVRVPPLGVQRSISEILEALDQRKSLLRETNVTLEAIAQALFKSWFVDFDPVRAKAEGRHPEGMDAATAALFPDGFEESELGLVPKGWNTGTLADLASLNPESWSVKTRPESLAYVDLANAKENVIGEITEYSFDEAPSRARRVLRDGDTIIGTVRPGNRSFAYIANAVKNLTGSTGFAVLRPKSIANTEFVYLAATMDASIDYLTHVADGGAYPAVRPEVVAGLSSVLPPELVLRAFHEIAKPVFTLGAENHAQAQTLTQLRDTLLPRLISGQLRIPEAEALIEEAV